MRFLRSGEIQAHEDRGTIQYIMSPVLLCSDHRSFTAAPGYSLLTVPTRPGIFSFRPSQIIQTDFYIEVRYELNSISMKINMALTSFLTF